MLGLKLRVCGVQEFHAGVPFSYRQPCRQLGDMADSITEIPKNGVQLPKWSVTLTVPTGVGKRLRTLLSHHTLGEPQGFSWGTLTNNKHFFHHLLVETRTAVSQLLAKGAFPENWHFLYWRIKNAFFFTLYGFLSVLKLWNTERDCLSQQPQSTTLQHELTIHNKALTNI